ncbi:cell wall-active antibiotics response protein LiaF [Pseudalkalibacillus decolorationis]|uniref:cell wall-active antibiotics response protein LiaF n=1 Tax=Pseudalkalibacillus decolorationis TaxID=163879 RepID=UPI0021496B08|nr:cell wall-active antibiotics response protein LiaF [Pseudalkalibacillus decolorationis]
MKVRSGGQFVIAIIFVLIGVMLLLVNLGAISMEINEALHFLYPFVILLLGLMWLLKAIFGNGGHGHWFWSLILTGLSVLLIADRFGYTQFGLLDVWKLWPIIIVYIGIIMLWGRRSGHDNDHKKSMAKGDRSGVSNIVADVSMKEDNWPVEPIDEWNGVSDFNFDFTRAFIPDNDTPIKLSGWVGDIKILIPEDVEFSVTSNSKVGDIKIGKYKRDGIMKNDGYKTDGYESATRKLTFNFRFQVLDLRIDRV